jgi:5,10-methylenetetrahydromethanopterin reductase
MSVPRLGLLYLGSRPARRVVEVVQFAEAHGFDACWIPDERFFREVYGLCTAAALATGTIRIGPGVTDPYTRHPALTAMAIATLDELSDGRAMLGLGAGISGFVELGLQHVRPATAMRETIELIRALLTGEPVSFCGTVFRFEGRLNFRPPCADIPIYVAAEGPHMLATAGAVADGAIIEACVAPGSFEAALAQVQAGAHQAGRDLGRFARAARIDVALADTLEEAHDALRTRMARRLISAAPTFESFAKRGIDVPDELRERVRGLHYTWDTATLNEVGRHIPTAYMDAFYIAATPDTLSARLTELVQRGANELIINPIPLRDDHVEPVMAAVGAWHASLW